MNNKLATVLFIFCISSLGKAQNPDEMISTFFETYESNKPMEALDKLYSHTPWLERIRDDVERLKTQFANLKSIVGEYHGREVLYQRKVKECFFIATYLVRYDRQPIRFNFEFYNPSDQWILYSFSYDDSFDDDLVEAAKRQFFMKSE